MEIGREWETETGAETARECGVEAREGNRLKIRDGDEDEGS